MENRTPSPFRGITHWEFIDNLSRTLGLSLAITSSDGRILWINEPMQAEFPGLFIPGRSLAEALNEATSPDTFGFPYLLGPFGEEMAHQVLRGGTLRRRVSSTGAVKVFRYFHFSFAEDLNPYLAHCLLDITPEKQLFETYRNNLHQLSSMKEMIDLLYESMGTQVVINLILVAVTAREGFGFNRAFFLEVSGSRLRGRLGIGPASAEEAHRIWSRLAQSNPSLRETLHFLSKAGGPPDPATQEVALKVDLPLHAEGIAVQPGGIIHACINRKPARVTRSSVSSSAEQGLFQLLGSEALAVVPLSIRDRLAGVLLADNHITRKPIAEEDLNLLKTFSGYAAIALERSYLHDELTRNLEKLRQANRDLQANHQKLMHAEKLSALGELAAYVSHEIRNPLVAIGGLARSILSEGAGSEESKEVLNIIVSEVQRLERFLKETLDFVKPPAGAFKATNLGEVIREVINTFRDEIHRARIELVLELPDQPVVSSVDPDFLRGALSNLIKNAQEAIDGSGGRICVVLREQAGLAEIEVGDTGPGIPEEIKGLIFEPFFTTKKDGTGIGLAITKQNICSLGGSISLESRPPYRTLFKIRLPISNSQAVRS
ncbi:MAG: GAF domain-containing protein [Planctomycetes bacterium]|nr:GAF domain-containing protein [Planctomycetota bacterium]